MNNEETTKEIWRLKMRKQLKNYDDEKWGNYVRIMVMKNKETTNELWRWLMRNQQNNCDDEK